jgi:hypothetical protein
MLWAICLKTREKIMTKIVYGIVHGKTIELDQELGLADGEQVEVAIQITGATYDAEPWGEGVRRCAGALADEWTAEDDRILEEIHQDRKRDTRKDISG